MSVMIPSAETLAQWAAEELWDWRVRLLFAAICALAVIVVLVVYLVLGRTQSSRDDGRIRRYFGRVSITLLVIMVTEISFFKEPVSAALLTVTALAIGAIAFNMPQSSESTPSEPEIASADTPEMQGESS